MLTLPQACFTLILSFSIFSWLKLWGVSVASEGKMRKAATNIVGENIVAEMAPLSTSVKEDTVVKPVPFVYVPRLGEKIQSVLEKNTEYV